MNNLHHATPDLIELVQQEITEITKNEGGFLDKIKN